jgi:hypothetical protein
LVTIAVLVLGSSVANAAAGFRGVEVSFGYGVTWLNLSGHTPTSSQGSPIFISHPPPTPTPSYGPFGPAYPPGTHPPFPSSGHSSGSTAGSAGSMPVTPTPPPVMDRLTPMEWGVMYLLSDTWRVGWRSSMGFASSSSSHLMLLKEMVVVSEDFRPVEGVHLGLGVGLGVRDLSGTGPAAGQTPSGFDFAAEPRVSLTFEVGSMFGVGAFAAESLALGGPRDRSLGVVFDFHTPPW